MRCLHDFWTWFHQVWTTRKRFKDNFTFFHDFPEFLTPYFDHTFDNIEQVTHENDTLTLPFGDHKIRNNLKLPNDDTYDILGPEICKEIDKEFHWYQSFFKYI